MINNVITSEDIEEYMCVLKDIKKGQERVRLDLDNESVLNVVESIGISVEDLKTEIAKRVEDYIIKYIAKEPREIIIACHQPTNEYQEYRDMIKEVIELIENTDGTAESIYELLEEYYEKIEEETGLEGGWIYVLNDVERAVRIRGRENKPRIKQKANYKRDKTCVGDIV